MTQEGMIQEAQNWKNIKGKFFTVKYEEYYQLPSHVGGPILALTELLPSPRGDNACILGLVEGTLDQQGMIVSASEGYSIFAFDANLLVPLD